MVQYVLLIYVMVSVQLLFIFLIASDIVGDILTICLIRAILKLLLTSCVKEIKILMYITNVEG